MKNKTDIGEIDRFIQDKSISITNNTQMKENQRRTRWRIVLLLVVIFQFLLIMWQFYRRE